SIIIITSFFKLILGDVWFNYAMFLVIIVGLLFALTFLLQDLIRLFNFSYMPPNAIRMCMAGLTPEELDTFSSTFVMVFGFAPLLFFNFPIFFIALLITAIADAMASIFGIRAYEKQRNHEFPKGSGKSFEGYLGGIFSTFLCVLFGVAFSNFFGLSNWSFTITIYLAIILSLVFFAIDVITAKILLQDNYLNPLVIGLITIWFLGLISIPIY
ncbi:MAG: hypothetical protein ACTSQJ_03275, partial [Promethearchaeota archaeon]